MFVRHISHEIRTPLNAVKMGLEVLLNQTASGSGKKSYKETLLELVKASDVVLEVVNDFLLFDKIESGIMILEREPLNIVDFVRESMATLLLQVRMECTYIICPIKDVSLSM